MSTSEDIEYDPDVLKAMSQKDMIYQLICRKDLDRPKRPKRLQAQQFFNEVCANLQSVIDNLNADPLTVPFAEVLEVQLAEFIANKEQNVEEVI